MHDGILCSLLKKALLITENTHKRKIHPSLYRMGRDVGMRFGHFNLTLPFPAYFEISAWQNLSNTSTKIVFLIPAFFPQSL